MNHPILSTPDRSASGRFRRWTAVMAVVGLLFGAAPVALAADEINLSNGHTAEGAPLALHGYDPVAFFNQGAPAAGNASHSSVHRGATYYFASKENKKAFERDPERYVPAFGGFCAYGVSVGKKFDGDPRYWTIWKDRLYLNLNGDIARQFAADVPGAVAKAEKQWRDIEHRPISGL